MEQFEDRVVPAVDLNLQVSTMSDVNDPTDGHRTLREAIQLCNDTIPVTHHTITFNQGAQGRTITLNPDPTNYGRLIVERNTHIVGLPEKITIQRDQNSETKHQLIYVKSGVTALLANLELRYGDNLGNGGAVISYGNLTIQSSLIHHNKTSGTGGGVQAQNGSLTITDCDFDYNDSTIGGAIFLNRGVGATITNSIFEHNVASSGGAIGILCPENGLAPTITLTHCFLLNNTATTRGGGIYVDAPTAGPGVLLYLKDGTEVANNQVTDNQGKGGGIYFGRGTITFEKGPTGPVKIANNTATNGDGMYRVTGTSVLGTTLPNPNPDYLYINDQVAVGDP